MAKITEVHVWSKERDEYGFPRKCNVYLLGPTTRIGDLFVTPTLRVRDTDHRIASPPNRIKARSEEEARAKSVDHFRQEADRLGLVLMLTEMPEV